MAEKTSSDAIFPVILDGRTLVRTADQDGDDPLRSSAMQAVSVDDLANDVRRLSETLSASGVFDKRRGEIQLHEVKLNLGVSASGEVGFIVAKGNVMASASVELVFKASEDEPN